MPFLQRVRQLVSDGRVQRLQSCLHQGKPGVDPRMDWDCVCQRIPVFNLKAKHRREFLSPSVGSKSCQIQEEPYCNPPVPKYTDEATDRCFGGCSWLKLKHCLRARLRSSAALPSYLFLQLGEDELIQNVIQDPHGNNMHPAVQEIHHRPAVPRLPLSHYVPDIWHPDFPHQSGKKSKLSSKLQPQAQINQTDNLFKSYFLLYSKQLDFNRHLKRIIWKARFSLFHH